MIGDGSVPRWVGRPLPRFFDMSDTNLPALVNEAFALLDLGLNDEALAITKRLVQSAPVREVRLAAMQVYIRLGMFDQACECADELLAMG